MFCLFLGGVGSLLTDELADCEMVLVLISYQ